MRTQTPRGDTDSTFSAWAADAEPRVRAALTALFGVQAGADAAAIAMSVAWERWEEIEVKPNPVGYVYGIGRKTAHRIVRRRRPVYSPVPPSLQPEIEPGLPDALAVLPERQRIAVTLVHGYGWSLAETAELMSIEKTTVQNHVDRAMTRLRRQLGVR